MRSTWKSLSARVKRLVSENPRTFSFLEKLASGLLIKVILSFFGGDW